VQRGNVKLDHLTFLRAMQYMAENGCRWRALPKEFGKWLALYRCFHYWIDIGVFDRIEKYLKSQAVNIKKIKIFALDRTYIKVHPDGTGMSKK